MDDIKDFSYQLSRLVEQNEYYKEAMKMVEKLSAKLNYAQGSITKDMIHGELLDILDMAKGRV